jgi:Zn-dependent protease with chaperone function
MVYLLIFTFAIFLIWVGAWFTIGLLSYHLSIRSIVCVIGGWIIIGGFLLDIIRSLFVYSHNDYPNRLEITQSEAPSLFKLIEEISNSVGEKMPKHVYLSPEVNACVFYNKPFISLFFQSRKNLEVGVGLLFGLNRQEFKAVIAHEYGHFGQKSMRVGQVVTICYNIISNLLNSDKVFLVQPILKKTFIYVQKGYMALSRSMEYEADSKSAMIAGNEAAISALCKVEIIANRFDVYNSLVQSIHDSKNIIPTSFWNGYKEFQKLAEDFDGIILDETITVSEPLSNSHKSKVKLKNPWISHPLLKQRIESIKLLTFNVSIPAKDGIQNVIPIELYNESSRLLFDNAGYSSATISNDTEYRELLEKELGEQFFTLAIRSFFNRDFCEFKVSPNEGTSTPNREDVFSEANAQLVESFNQAISDYQLMVMFKNKQTSEKQIQYDGKIYNRKNVPIETELNIIKGLEPRIASIDKAICLLALSKTKNKGLIMKAYDDIFYAQSIIRHISNVVLPSRNHVAKQIGKGGEKDEKSFKRDQQILLNFKANMRELIESIEINRLNPVMHIDTAKSLNHIQDKWLLEGPSISGEEIQYIFTLPDQIIAQFQALAYYSKKIISDTIEDKEPLIYWNNSVSAQTIRTQDES